MSRTLMLWLIWIMVSAAGGLFVVGVIVYGGNRSFLLIGRTTDGHHQIELACDACHTSVFGGQEVLQTACVGCHGAELKAANDAHPLSKFTDPRNADRTEVLDARYCGTCHREHRQGVTRAMGVTLPDDFCVKCHSDIGEDRASHKGLAFNTCASAGCHNFHDNRALYQDFLIKHAGEPAQLALQKSALADFLKDRTNAIDVAKAPLARTDARAPPHRMREDIVMAWSADAHARGGVNCSGCHATPSQPAAWVEKPGIETCKGCHAAQARTFTQGKHGMRLADGLFATRDGPFGLWKKRPLPSMTPIHARIPMKADAGHAELGCNSCHGAHKYDTRAASVEACRGCHNDQHTRAYFASPHYDLFKKESSGAAAPGTGVSCATCHMPTVEVRDEDGRKLHFTTHNQNDNLRPNEKMVRSVCASCHGLQFTLDALADPKLVGKNFNGDSTVHIESIEWAKKRVRERTGARK